MYGRVIDGREHTFGVSGKLIMNALVMYDHQTGTLWSQFLREGVRGELKGTELEVVPVTQTTWETWRELHPDTVVLDKGGRYDRDHYRGYYTDSRAGVLGEFVTDARLDAKALVLGLIDAGLARAYPLEVLRSKPVVNDSIGESDLLVYFDGPSGTALAYDRNVDGQTLTFKLEGEPKGALTVLIDDQTGSRWTAFQGAAIAGALKGRRLKRLPSHLSFWFAWKDWNPGTELYGD